jgi:hypothetical protein
VASDDWRRTYTVIYMAIDLSSEIAISIAEATELWGRSRGGKPTHPSRVIKAIKNGTRVPGGGRVYLEGLRLGGQWVTSREAIQRYALLLTAAVTGRPAALAPVSPARAGALARVDRALDAAGIGTKRPLTANASAD